MSKTSKTSKNLKKSERRNHPDMRHSHAGKKAKQNANSSFLSHFGNFLSVAIFVVMVDAAAGNVDLGRCRCQPPHLHLFAILSRPSRVFLVSLPIIKHGLKRKQPSTTTNACRGCIRQAITPTKFNISQLGAE